MKLILRSSRADANFTADEWRVLAQALDFRDLEVSDLMRPFSEAITLSADQTVEANLDRIAEHRYSRYPYIDRRGRIQGVIHVKDLFLAQRKGGVLTSLGKLTRPVPTVRPDLPAIEVFRRFSGGAPHFAVIAFEDERPLGFVTLDNLLGALVGEIRDEFRQTENEWTTLEDGSLIGKGSLPIFTLERVLGIDIEESEVGSVGGLIYQKLGDVPVEGQLISFDRFDVVITSMEGPRIAELRILPKEESAPDLNAGPCSDGLRDFRRTAAIRQRDQRLDQQFTFGEFDLRFERCRCFRVGNRHPRLRNDRARVVVPGHPMHGDAAFALAGGQDGRVDRAAEESAAAEFRQQRRMRVDQPARKARERLQARVVSCSPPAATRSTPASSSDLGDRLIERGGIGMC